MVTTCLSKTCPNKVLRSLLWRLSSNPPSHRLWTLPSNLLSNLSSNLLSNLLSNLTRTTQRIFPHPLPPTLQLPKPPGPTYFNYSHNPDMESSIHLLYCPRPLWPLIISGILLFSRIERTPLLLTRVTQWLCLIRRATISLPLIPQLSFPNSTA